MDEQEWLTCDDPTPMLEFLRGNGRKRKRRLFSCGCCRLAFGRYTPAKWERVVEVGERYADGLASNKERSEAFAAAKSNRWRSGGVAAYACHADASHANAVSVARCSQSYCPLVQRNQAT